MRIRISNHASLLLWNSNEYERANKPYRSRVSSEWSCPFKIAYDAIVEKFKTRRADQERFASERKAIYDEFLVINKEDVAYRRTLQDLTLIARAGKQVKPEIMRDFPDSPMSRLTDTVEKMRRIAHTHEIVKVAERIVALHGDAATALRFYLTNDSLMYGLPLFLADRLGEVAA